MNNPWKLTTFALAAALVTAIATGTSKPAEADQPFMEAAREHLNAAKDLLEHGSDEHGGFRVKAIEDTRHAVDDVNRGIDWKRHH
jgi:hypothetical protein